MWWWWLFLGLAITATSSSTTTCVGHVFVDVNGNGVQESFELNAQGQTFVSSEGQTVVSNAQGNFFLLYSNASAPGNNFTVVVPQNGILTTPPETRPIYVLLSPAGACVLNNTGLANVPSTTLTSGQILTLSVFGGLLGAVWLSGVGFVIYHRFFYTK